MARIRSRPSTSSEGTKDALIDALVKALKDEEQEDPPVIFEVTTGGTDFFEVIVVWARWADLSVDVRTRIVLDAYQRFGVQSSNPDIAEQVSAILPVTADQAIEMGILSYSVQSGRHRSDANDERIQQLMKNEGAIETDTGIELRLPTLQMAREAKAHLEDETRDMAPSVHWQISQQVGRVIEY